jgi:hypothetical protein
VVEVEAVAVGAMEVPVVGESIFAKSKSVIVA